MVNKDGLRSFVRTIPMKVYLFVFSNRRRHTTSLRDWSSDVCSSDLGATRDCEHDQLRLGDGRVFDGRCLDTMKVRRREVAGIAAALSDSAHLLGVAARERDVMTAVAQEARKGGSPG